MTAPIIFHRMGERMILPSPMMWDGDEFPNERPAGQLWERIAEGKTR